MKYLNTFDSTSNAPKEYTYQQQNNTDDDTLLEELPRLSVGKNILRFDSEENRDWQYVTVDTNQEWKVYKQAQWVEIKKFNSSFRVRVDENSGQCERRSLIKITAGSLVRTVRVVQKGKPMPHHLSSDNSNVYSNAKKEKEKDEEFSFIGCLYMIAIAIFLSLIIKYIFLT